MISRAVVFGVLFAACGAPDHSTESPPVSRPDTIASAPLQGVALHVRMGEGEPLTLTLAGAWLEEGGDGEGVDARAVVPTAPPLQVQAHRSRWRMKDQVVVFEGRVVATRADLTLIAERLEMTYSGDRVVQAVATGGVVVTSGEEDGYKLRVATADRAVLKVEEGEIALTGSPRVTEGPHEMSGERIVLYVDDDEVVCEACSLTVSGDAVEPAARTATFPELKP